MNEVIDWNDVRRYLLEGEAEEKAREHGLCRMQAYRITHSKTKRLTHKNLPFVQEMVALYKERKKGLN